LLNNGDDYYFSIPVQYIGDYHIGNFAFDNGYILLGDYKLTLERDDLSIDVFVNESSDEYGNTDGVHNLVYSETNSKVLISKMEEPLTKNHIYDNMLNQYNIFIKNSLKNSDIKSIIKEYKKGNTYSKFYLEYTITIDNEQMTKCGLLDDFELYNVPVQEPPCPEYTSSGSSCFPPNLEFFRAKVLQK
jgi:hypothetical protein